MDWEGDRVPKIREIWMLERSKKSLKNRWFSRPKSRTNVKKTPPKTPFFALAFFTWFWKGLGLVLGGFWEGFGAFLASLGPLLASFFGACILNALLKGSWRLLGWILTPFWGGWEGSGEDFGRVLGEFGDNLEGQKLNFSDCASWFRVLVVEGFGPKTRSRKTSYVA